jgi:hypothetical protein
MQNYNAANLYYAQQQAPVYSARNSMYGSYNGRASYMSTPPVLPIRPHPQIIFSDNYHQVFKMVSSL